MAKPDYIAFNMAATISSLAKMRVRWGRLSTGMGKGAWEVRKRSAKVKYLRSYLKCLGNNEIILLLETALQRKKSSFGVFVVTAHPATSINTYKKNVYLMY